jgi:hypothetical protein
VAAGPCLRRGPAVTAQPLSPASLALSSARRRRPQRAHRLIRLGGYRRYWWPAIQRRDRAVPVEQGPVLCQGHVVAPRRGRSRSRTTLRRPLLRLTLVPLTPPTPPATPVSFRYSMGVAPYSFYRAGCHIHALASHLPSQLMARTRRKWRMRAPSQRQGHPRHRPAMLRPELDTLGETLSTRSWVLCIRMFHRCAGVRPAGAGRGSRSGNHGPGAAGEPRDHHAR